MLRRSAALGFQRTVASHMRVCVGVKRCVDYTVKVRVKDNKVHTEGAKMSVNPFDEIALEEASRLKEKKIVTEIVAITIGNKKAEEALRTAMALGADKAIHIVVPEDVSESLEPLAVAKIFAKLHAELKPDLWILGKQAIDDDCGVTPQLLAGLTDLPQGTFASVVEVVGGKVKVTRELDSGRQVVELATPCVLAADLRLNTPRFATLPNIMKARKKPIDARDVASLGVDISRHTETVSVVEPTSRKSGSKVKTVEELVDKLRNEAKAI